MIKRLEIKTSMLLNLVCANVANLSSSFLFLVIINLYFLIHAVISQRIWTEEAKGGIELHPVTAEAKARECLI